LKIITIHTKTYSVASEWNELSGSQLLKVMDVLYGNYEVDAARLLLLKILTRMSWYGFCKIPMPDKAEFLDVTHFLINDNTLTKQLLPQYDGFYGPDDDFNNITGEEFIFSEDFYFKSFSQDTADGPRTMIEAGLNGLASVLYREQKKDYDFELNPDGDPRKPFNQNIAAFNENKIVTAWPMNVKLAIFTWYETCRQRMILANPEIFSSGSGEPAKYGLLSVMRAIAEGGIHGKFDDVAKMYVKMWMVELNEKVAEAKQQEKAAT
jgi:hypothetical protein